MAPDSHDQRASLLRRYSDALGHLSRSALRKVGDVEAVYRELTELSSRTLDVHRVSVWLTEIRRDVITCHDLYESQSRSHQHGATLTRLGHPAYFSALDACRVIDAHDACRDPRTSEFTNDYLRPLGIASMLDAPIMVAGTQIGVVCFEHCGQPRVWTDEEQTFAASVADFAALATETARRMQAETDARQRAEQLLQSQKMESLGRLAGGIAHDFNNLLTAISMHSDRLRSRLPAGSSDRSHAEAILTTVDRATGLTRQLLDFARPCTAEPQTIDAVATLRHIGVLMRRLLREDIDIRVRVPEQPLPVCMSPSRFEQLILNLAINAQDAMPEGGILEIALERHVPTSDQPAEHVLLVVRDNGTGMDAETAAHVFEPFFTTKEPGRGTGLGLSICYGIVQQADGHISLHSRAGQGTTFLVRLPLSDSAFAGEVSASRRTSPDLMGGGETILLVEDEKLLRELTARLLREVGYDVIEAGDGEGALAVSASSKRHIHLALCDVVVPGVHGGELVRRLRSERPGLRALFMSGYIDDHQADDRDVRACRLLAKPFTRDELITEVRAVLLGPPA